MSDKETLQSMLDQFNIDYEVGNSPWTRGYMVSFSLDKVAGVGSKSVDWYFNLNGEFLWVE